MDLAKFRKLRAAPIKVYRKTNSAAEVRVGELGFYSQTLLLLIGVCMRFLVLVLAAFISTASFAARQSISDYCGDAAGFVEQKYGARYDREGFEGFDCKRSPVGRAIECTVAASKGNGAAIDTFRVILNTRCSRYYRIDLVSEE